MEVQESCGTSARNSKCVVGVESKGALRGRSPDALAYANSNHVIGRNGAHAGPRKARQDKFEHSRGCFAAMNARDGIKVTAQYCDVLPGSSPLCQMFY